jgi:hypothetical protein
MMDVAWAAALQGGSALILLSRVKLYYATSNCLPEGGFSLEKHFTACVVLFQIFKECSTF